MMPPSLQVVHWLACVNAMLYFATCEDPDDAETCPQDSWWAMNALSDKSAAAQYEFAIFRAFAQASCPSSMNGLLILFHARPVGDAAYSVGDAAYSKQLCARARSRRS